MTCIAVIPARGGSRRIPRKNIRPFLGVPIMKYSINTALESQLFTKVYVSTEDKEIAELAYQFGATVIWRPVELAEIGAPDCGTQEVTRHAISAVDGPFGTVPDDYVCCIYATAPLLRASSLRLAFQVLSEGQKPYVYSTDMEGRDAGQFYWGTVEAFMNRVPLDGNSCFYKLPSSVVCDLNEPADWEWCEKMYQAYL